MALKKSIENNAGVSFEYWRVMPEMSVNFAEGIAHARVSVWFDQNARQANKRSIHIHDVLGHEAASTVEGALVLSGSDFTSAVVTGDLRAALYAKLKVLDVFQGYVDV